MKKNSTLKVLLMCAFLFSVFNSNAQDWANLNRFRADNALLGAPQGR